MSIQDWLSEEGLKAVDKTQEFIGECDLGEEDLELGVVRNAAGQYITDYMNRWPWWKKAALVAAKIIPDVLWVVGLRQMRHGDDRAMIRTINETER